MTDRFEVAEAAIREAGALALRHAGRLAQLDVRSKGTQDVVTEADLEIELLLRHRLLEAFPEDRFFGEETGADALEGAHGLWVVDPIDGTQPFVSGMASWCISVAFVQDGELDFGLILAPRMEAVRGWSRSPRHSQRPASTPHRNGDAADMWPAFNFVINIFFSSYLILLFEINLSESFLAYSI